MKNAIWIAVMGFIYALVAGFCLGTDWKQSIGIFCALMAVAPIVK